MTVYLHGKDGRPDQVEEHVQTVFVTDKYIDINYDRDGMPYGIVTGVSYYADEMQIERIEA